MPETVSNTTYNAWPHRWAVLLCCAVFPLIWLGALVTTYDAGMAVPDWPGTYGYNMFLYPWQTWVYGPFELFIEHGHRLLGSLAGMLTIGLVVACFWTRRPRWVSMLSLVTLAAVIGQGVLGGLRVLLDERLVALIHGCTGPAFFALCVAVAVVTSRRWHAAKVEPSSAVERGLYAATVLTVALAFTQLVLGALLRHLPVDASPGFFRAAVLFHVLMALVLAIQVGATSYRVLRQQRGRMWLTRPASLLAILVGMQLLLGLGTWVLKYSFPSQLGGFQFAAEYLVVANSLTQSLVTTAHVAVGSLILATSTMLAVRSARLTAGASSSVPFEVRMRGLAL